jgi:hypothetical protein
LIIARCGRRAFDRTVVVNLRFPEPGFGSASLSQGTVFVSLLPARYHVWEVAH